MTNQPEQPTTHHEVCDTALRHYKQLVEQTGSWSSTVEDAIEFYKIHGGEQPTTVEGIVEEFRNTFKVEILKSGFILTNRVTGEIVSQNDLEAWLRTTLTTLQATHEREKRELVREIHEEVGDYNDGCGCCMEDTASVHIKAIATRHNIDLSDPTEGSK